MEKLVITGGKPLTGEIVLQGAKNVALKMFVASLLTDDELILHNIPLIRDVYIMLEVLRELGVSAQLNDHTVRLKHTSKGETVVPLEVGARLRTSTLVLGPLLTRFHSATIPNPGGCRLGARTIDRHVTAIEKMGANIRYDSSDGYFHATAEKLVGTTIRFEKNTHTGTEAVILAAVLAVGTTVIENAAQEIEVDDLINLLNQMGAKIIRQTPSTIVIEGVSNLNGAEYSVMPDRNEEVTFAVASAITHGNVVVKSSIRQHLSPFMELFQESGGIVEHIDSTTTRYSVSSIIKPSDVVTHPHPGFMTDWQGPWAVFMTQATGVSTIHETVFERRFSYVKHLNNMGADISYFDPIVNDPENFYNFHWHHKINGFHQGIRIIGPTSLHNAVVEMDDIRAGATLVLAALSATGESYLYQAEILDRGYEAIEKRLQTLGATIDRVKEDEV